MAIVAFGLNHKTSPLTFREKVFISNQRTSAFLQKLCSQPTIVEAVLLSTCNRTEVYALVNRPEEGFQQIMNALSEKVTTEELLLHSYRYLNMDAVVHLFEVASGMDSQVVGETEILGQVKKAFELSKTSETTGTILHRLMGSAIAAGKRARTETKISEGFVSIGSAAAEVVSRIFADLSGKAVLLIGAGEIAELCARHLVARGVTFVLVSNRTLEKAKSLAQEFKGVAVDFSQLESQLKTVDVAIASTGAPHPVIYRETLSRIMKARKNRPIFIIDLAVPRDVEAEAGNLDNVFLYNLDDLKAVCDEYKTARDREVTRATLIVKQEAEIFMDWRNGLQAVPIINLVKEYMEQARISELAKLKGKITSLPKENQELVEQITRSLTQTILSGPMKHLKELTREKDQLVYLEALRRMFAANNRKPGQTNGEK